MDTPQKQFAALSFNAPFLPSVPFSLGTIEQDDQQQLQWGYPGILWGAAAVLAFVFDLNTRLMVYLRSYYSVSGGDLSTLVSRYLAGLSGDYNARMRRLVQDANDAMGV